MQAVLELTPMKEMIFRKADVRKAGTTRGFELVLSHSLRDKITTGFARGTPTSAIAKIISHVMACAAQASYPLLLPVLVLAEQLSPGSTEQQDREIRARLLQIETELHTQSTKGIPEVVNHNRDAILDVSRLRDELLVCQSLVRYKSPELWLRIIDRVEIAGKAYWDQLPVGERTDELKDVHASILGRLDLHRARLEGVEGYSRTTLERLGIQRGLVCNPFFPKRFWVASLAVSLPKEADRGLSAGKPRQRERSPAQPRSRRSTSTVSHGSQARRPSDEVVGAPRRDISARDVLSVSF